MVCAIQFLRPLLDANVLASLIKYLLIQSVISHIAQSEPESNTIEFSNCCYGKPAHVTYKSYVQLEHFCPQQDNFSLSYFEFFLYMSLQAL